MNDKELVDAKNGGSDGASATHKLHWIKLGRDVVLSRPGKHGEPKRVAHRITKGTLVALLWVHDDPKDRTPFQCMTDGFPGTFWLGRDKGHEFITREVALTFEGDKVVHFRFPDEVEVSEG